MALTPEQELAQIRKKLGYLTYDSAPRHWLDTGAPRLNAVLGSAERGLAYGKMIELFGWESNGKTLLALLLAALAQADGATVAWLDTEDSFDPSWAQAQGLDPGTLYVFKPRIGIFEGEKKERLQTAEELCTEVETWLSLHGKKDPDGKRLLVVDSVTGFLVEEEAAAGLTGANMRTKGALASFLSRLLRRWIALAAAHNCIMVFINQLRVAPGVVYGNPEYTGGGKALKFYCSVRAKVRRVKGGQVLQKGRMVGLRGVIKNVKNKSGEGSQEGTDCGFKAMFLKNDWRFMSTQKVQKSAEGEEE